MSDRDKIAKIIREARINASPMAQLGYPEADALINHGAILPPCKVGDMVYIIKYCRCGEPECFTAQQCYKKLTKRTPKEYGRVMKQQNGRRLKPNIYGRLEHEWRAIGTICHIIYQKPFDLSMLTEIGKTVFLTREEAEKKLAERNEKV